jgi:hypothetical protein
VVPTITTYRKVGAFYIACNGDLSPTARTVSKSDGLPYNPAPMRC